MMKDSEEKVLKRVITALEENHIPFQVTGGLAAIFYGTKRPLYDIDIDVYEKDMAKVKELFKPFLTKDLFHCEDPWWNGWLMIFKIDGVLVDISQVEEWYAVSPSGEKKRMTATPEDAEVLEVAGMQIPTVRKEVLIEYKKHMARATDMEDISQIS
ncbi:MAG: hypothetical protein Q7R88_03130 [bacterium]|nr:hypothetical protein [bacterium]